MADQELEWLKTKSGLTDAELAEMSGLIGNAKVKTLLAKVIASEGESSTRLETAEATRLAFEEKYDKEIVPQLRQVAQDAVRLDGENASLKAQLKRAKEYGMDLGDGANPNPAANADPALRAPGSPDPSNYITKDQFAELENKASIGISAINDLNAEHFKLYGSPVPDMTGLVNEVTRQRKLGNTADLRSVWEAKHNVTAKRQEIAAAEKKTSEDAIRADERKRIAEASGSNPNLRMGQTSRFSQFDPSKGSGDNKAMPWQGNSTQKRASNAPWREFAAKRITEATG